MRGVYRGGRSKIPITPISVKTVCSLQLASLLVQFLFNVYFYPRLLFMNSDLRVLVFSGLCKLVEAYEFRAHLTVVRRATETTLN